MTHSKFIYLLSWLISLFSLKFGIKFQKLYVCQKLLGASDGRNRRAHLNHSEFFFFTILGHNMLSS